MSETNAPAVTVPADAVCVLVGAGTKDILGGQSFQTYSPDGAKKAATKLENVHKEQNAKLANILSIDEASRDDAQKAFLKDYGTSPKPEALEIRIIDGLSFAANIVPRSTPKPVVPLTEASKAERLAKLRAQLEALESAETVG